MDDPNASSVLDELPIAVTREEKRNKRRLYSREWMRVKRKTCKTRETAHNLSNDLANLDGEHEPVDVGQSESGPVGVVLTSETLRDPSSIIDDKEMSESNDKLSKVSDLNESYSDKEMPAIAEDDSLNNSFILSPVDECLQKSESLNEGCSLRNDLAEVCMRTRMSTVQIDEILRCLNRHPEKVKEKLPLSYKSLLEVEKTPLRDRLKTVSGHKYYYIGLEKQLKFVLARFPSCDIESLCEVKLVWNTDGMELFNSRRENVWPILAYISNLRPRIVFEVALTVGKGKPANLEFLEEFIVELNDLMERGIVFNGKRIMVRHKACVCDAPARAFVKNTLQFSSKVGCDQCEQIGVHDGKRVTWVGYEKGLLRSDESIRTKRQAVYHKTNDMESPLLKLNIDLVKDVPPDFMHQGGGLMKKILTWLINGPRKSCNNRYWCRMSAKNVEILDERITYINKFMPKVFCRKLRSIREFPDYKYTELRQILLYTGKLLFMELTSNEEQYEHFVALSSICCLMVDCDKIERHYDLVKRMMKSVIEGFQEYYGESFLTYNAHVFQHLPDVAAYHEGLDEVSAYRFENHLGQIKKFVTSSHDPLVSIINGIQRRNSCDKSKPSVHKPTIEICDSPPNNIYVDIKQHKVFEIIGTEFSLYVMKQFTHLNPLFTTPLSSSVINCYNLRISGFRIVKMSKDDVLQMRQGVKIDMVNFPGLSDPFNDSAMILTLLHNYNDTLY